MSTLTRFAAITGAILFFVLIQTKVHAQDYDTGIYYSDDYEYDDYDEYPPIVVYRYGVFFNSPEMLALQYRDDRLPISVSVYFGDLFWHPSRVIYTPVRYRYVIYDPYDYDPYPVVVVHKKYRQWCEVPYWPGYRFAGHYYKHPRHHNYYYPRYGHHKHKKYYDNGHRYGYGYGNKNGNRDNKNHRDDDYNDRKNRSQNKPRDWDRRDGNRNDNRNRGRGDNRAVRIENSNEIAERAIRKADSRNRFDNDRDEAKRERNADRRTVVRTVEKRNDRTEIQRRENETKRNTTVTAKRTEVAKSQRNVFSRNEREVQNRENNRKTVQQNRERTSRSAIEWNKKVDNRTDAGAKKQTVKQDRTVRKSSARSATNAKSAKSGQSKSVKREKTKRSRDE